MSIGFLMEDPDEAVIWRGPKKTGTYTDTCHVLKVYVLCRCIINLYYLKVFQNYVNF